MVRMGRRDGGAEQLLEDVAEGGVGAVGDAAGGDGAVAPGEPLVAGLLDHAPPSAAVGTVSDPSTAADVRPWQFATDGGWTCGVHGIPTVGFAPGEERYAHTNTERLELESARWGLERYPDLIRAVQAAL